MHSTSAELLFLSCWCKLILGGATWPWVDAVVYACVVYAYLAPTSRFRAVSLMPYAPARLAVRPTGIKVQRSCAMRCESG